MVVSWGGRRPIGWRKDKMKPYRRALWVLCALAVLWSSSLLVGKEPGPSRAAAEVAALH